MADPDEHPPPLTWIRRTISQAWRDLKSVYYANTLIWRVLKSGALVFLGLFTWVGSNLILSYQPDWTFLWYPAAYGFVLLLWGPLTHFVVVPLVIRVRRMGKGGVYRYISRHGSKVNLATFILIVLVLGTFPLGVMSFEFQLSTDGGSDINPDLECTKAADRVHCHLSDPQGIDSVVVTSGGETVETVDAPPFDFDIDRDSLATVRGSQQFVVELRNAEGEPLRRYSRTVDLIPGG